MSDFGWTDMGEYMEREHPVHLDGQVYHPSPHIVDDVATGFDIDGNYHVNGAALDPRQGLDITYRYALDLQERVLGYIQDIPYTVSPTDRDDIAQDILSELGEENAFDDSDVAFNALNRWREIYG